MLTTEQVNEILELMEEKYDKIYALYLPTALVCGKDRDGYRQTLETLNYVGRLIKQKLAENNQEKSCD